MRIVIGLLFILSSEMLHDGSASKEHVHFKIYVPEIINHLFHTKTVFVHIHKPDISIPKKSKPMAEAPKKNYFKEMHQEDWSSWNSYGYHNDHDDEWGNDLPVAKNQKDHKDDDVHIEIAHKNNPFLSGYHRDSYMPVSHHDKPDHSKEHQGDMMGYSRPPQYPEQEDVRDMMMRYPRPPQYAVQEDVKEIDHNDIEPYVHTYEEGYSRGGESATGHVYSGDVTKFYDDKHEKGEHSAEEYENESHDQETKKKTHAGRYFADDSDYHHDNNRYKANKRVSRMFILP